ncbi:MAG: bifunctional riboflavin kinase/FAD synthetase [Myxococcota bacterium]
MYRGTAEIVRPLERPVLTIGNFDGLHLGHRTMLKTVIERARALSGRSVVYTFEPHPRKVLYPEKAPRLLTTFDQKQELLEEIGVDVLVAEPFDRDFAQVTPDRFVREYIHQGIRPLEVYVGYDFHYGRDREGSMRLLTETGPRLGFAVTIIPEVTVGGSDVSSTGIRDLLADGRVEDAARLLARPFAVRGTVVPGDRRGRTIGFPTANLETENEVLPAAGVYAGELQILDEGERAARVRRAAVLNVGVRPTFEDGQGFLTEAHLLDWDGDLYGRRVEVDFRHRLRGEQRFDGVEALRAQIARDVEEARQRLGA